ncbi:hypothetical protein [Streptomyces sp. NPDC091371]
MINVADHARFCGFTRTAADAARAAASQGDRAVAQRRIGDHLAR